MAKFNNVLKHVMNMLKGSVRYLYPRIQNEIIHCLANKLRPVLI